MISEYALFPIFANHYTRQSALVQKLKAVAYRTETQSRDIFDLFFLIQKGTDLLTDKSRPLTHEERESAKSHLEQLTYESYRGQVLAYLTPEYQQEYSSPQMWEAMQKTVAQFLEPLKR